MAFSRRRFLTGAAAAGAVLVARPAGVLAQALGPVTVDAVGRASRLGPGYWLVHADLHNHSLFSDGDGDPAKAFASMRANGLDVAALTDHSVMSAPLGVAMTVCGDSCTPLRGIDEASWQAAGQMADKADDPGTFTALRGFEWSSPTLGHVNVWFSQEWVDPERNLGLVGVEGVPGFADEIPEIGPSIGQPLEKLVNDVLPDGLSMIPFYDWLKAEPGRPVLGGGADAIAGFNHPGREPGRFAMFGFDERLADRIVSMELFNRNEDYLFEAVDRGRPSPLPQCLDAGWRVGLLGVTDEHGTNWGAPDGKGRAGLWVRELSRAGVREAMAARRFFGTRERAMRLDATLGGVRMGGTVGHRSGPLPLVLDVAGPGWEGRELLVQVLRTGAPLPTVIDQYSLRVPAASEPLATHTVPLNAADGRWVVVRVVDPAGQADSRATGPLAAGNALAYTSPWWLDPDRPSTAPAAAGSSGAATGDGVEADRGVAVLADQPILPATGVFQGGRAVAAGLAVGAAIAAGSVRRHLNDQDHDHDHSHDHGHGHGHGHGDGDGHGDPEGPPAL